MNIVLPKRVVFCCTANRIRSVFAERAAVELRLRPRWLATVPLLSRGTEAFAGRPAWPEAVTAAKKLGIDLGDHKSAALTDADLDGAWLLGMTREHVTRSPGAWRSGLLGDFSGHGEIADPVGQAESAYLAAFEAILDALQAWSRWPSP